MINRKYCLICGIEISRYQIVCLDHYKLFNIRKELYTDYDDSKYYDSYSEWDIREINIRHNENPKKFKSNKGVR